MTDHRSRPMPEVTPFPQHERRQERAQTVGEIVIAAMVQKQTPGAILRLIAAAFPKMTAGEVRAAFDDAIRSRGAKPESDGRELAALEMARKMVDAQPESRLGDALSAAAASGDKRAAEMLDAINSPESIAFAADLDDAADLDPYWRRDGDGWAALAGARHKTPEELVRHYRATVAIFEFDTGTDPLLREMIDLAVAADPTWKRTAPGRYRVVAGAPRRTAESLLEWYMSEHAAPEMKARFVADTLRGAFVDEMERRVAAGEAVRDIGEDGQPVYRKTAAHNR